MSTTTVTWKIVRHWLLPPLMPLQCGLKYSPCSTEWIDDIPLLPKIETELQRMLQLGVIEKVTQLTEWCSGMVVVPKSNGNVRICVDLTMLNKSVKREQQILPSVDQALAQIGGAKIFTKLDANSGF